MLHDLERHLKTFEFAAVLVEPIQLSSNGIVPTASLLNELHLLCKRYGTLLIFDEILTGFYRTGSCFFYNDLAFAPDILLAGKALANGFPASALIVSNEIDTSILSYRLGSTYSNHPLTCAAICACIELSKTVDLTSAVYQISKTIRSTLHPRKLFGQGAAWCYRLSKAHTALELATRLASANIVVSFFPNYIRLLPSYFVDLSVLQSACETIRLLDGE